MARCLKTMGTGSLMCCRIPDHPTDDGPATHDGCCMHWAPFIRGIGDPHTLASRATAGHTLRCSDGAALDGG